MRQPSARHTRDCESQSPNPTTRSTLLRDAPDSTDRVFSARRVTDVIRLSICVHRFLRLRKPTGLLSPFADVDGSPVRRLLRGLRPVRILPRSPRRACFRSRQTRTVPMFPSSTPWMVRLSALPLAVLESKMRRSGLLPDTVSSYLPDGMVKPTRVTPRCPLVPSHY